MRVTEQDGQSPEQGELSDEDKAKAEQFEAFAVAIAAKRDEAKKARAESGIEDVWRECEESYVGIDDTNRHEFVGAKWMKATTMAGGMTERRVRASAQATGFVRLTSRYVDAGSAKVSEITIPVDGKGFSLKHTPVPEASKLKDSTKPFIPPGAPGPVMRPAGPDDMPVDPLQQQRVAAMAGGVAPAEVPLTEGDLAKHAIEQAEESAKKAETRIHDWMVECSHAAQMRKVIFDGARIGVGVLKGPIPDKVASTAVRKTPVGVAVEIQRKTKPVTRWVDPWNCFPDPACGEDIHDGDYFLERDFLPHGKLEALKRSGFYIEGAIDKVLLEGPGRINVEPQNPKAEQVSNRKQFEIWYFYGRISYDDLVLTNLKEAEALKKEGHACDSVFAIVTLVNETPIRVTVNPLDSGSFPYHSFSWRRRAGYWAGVGVGEQIRFPQRLINSATRAGMNNAAKSAGSLIVLDDELLSPRDGNWALTPDKIIGKNAETGLALDVRQAMAVFNIPNVTPQIMLWVEYAFKLAEESTNIPLITQGQSGKTTPDTFGGQQLQDNNANQLLRDVGYSVADDITNPLVRQMYEWLLLDPDVPEDEKGDHQVDANAAIALVEKALQDQAILMIAPMAADPEFGFDKAKIAKAFLRIKRLAPSDLMLSDDEIKKRKETPPPPPPQIAAAQIRAESAEKIAAGNQNVQAERNAQDLDRDTLYEQAIVAREQIAAGRAEDELQMKWQLGMLDYALKNKLTLQQAKVELTKLSMELRLQKELAGADGEGPQVKTPKVEPEGRAPEGRAFQA